MGKKTAKKKRSKAGVKSVPSTDKILLTDVPELILSARRQVAQTVNVGLTMLNWHIGDRIRREILKEQRAAYGKEIVAALRRQLT